MTKQTRRYLLHAGSFILAAGLLALALYGVDLRRMLEALRAAEWRWLAPLVVLVLGSNLFRAWRWQVLIDALPTTPDLETLDHEDPTRTNTLEASFSSIMIGYMVNYVAPRMGEVARTANMSARSAFRFSSLFGTVVSERIFDTAVLGLALLSALGLLRNRLGVLHDHFFAPAWSTISSLPFGGVVAGGVGALVLVWGTAVLLRTYLFTEESVLARFWNRVIKPALLSFQGGLMTLLRSPRRGAILVSTVGMWMGYLLMAYIPFVMLGLAEPYGIGLGDAWALMAIGALGLLVPTPGGVGSYHYITEQALVHLYGMPAEEALTYAVLAHAAQFIFYVLTGGLAMMYQATGPETLYPPSEDSRTVEDERP